MAYVRRGARVEACRLGVEKPGDCLMVSQPLS
jgi:hypothetical protein